MLSTFVSVVMPRTSARLRVPHRHICASTKNGASIAVFDRVIDATPTRVLLIRRGKAPNKGLWSLPGGRVKQDESIRDAALRELYEETSILPSYVIASNEHLEELSFPPYTVHVFAGMLTHSVVPAHGDDAKDARFFEVNQIPSLDRTHDLENVVERALVRLPQLKLS